MQLALVGETDRTFTLLAVLPLHLVLKPSISTNKVCESQCRELELVRIISKRTGSSQDDVIARWRKTPPTRIKRVRSLE